MLMRGKFAGAASEAIMIELKERGAGTPANITLDPVKLDPKHYQVIIDMTGFACCALEQISRYWRGSSKC